MIFFSITAGMKEMRLTGVRRNGSAPVMIESKFIHEKNLLDIFFEANPIDKLCDQRIRVRARPLHIVYDCDTVSRLFSIFARPQSVNLSELEGAATAQMANFKERSATGMQYMIEKRSIIDLDVQFMPNVLILPECGTLKSSGKQSLIVVSLGQLSIKAKPRDKSFKGIENMFSEGQDHSIILKSVMEKAYDNYSLSIDDIQLLIARSNEPWNDILHSGKVSEMHVLRPTAIIVEIGLCVVDDDPRLSKTKVNILLPSIDINISEERMFEALRVVTTLEFPKNEEAAAYTSLKKSISSLSIRKSLPNFLIQDRKSKQSQPDTGLVEEIVQYTNVELSFALKEIKIALYKSMSTVDNVETLSTGSTYFGTPIEEITNDNEFHDAQKDLQTMRNESFTFLSNAGQQKIILLQVLQLEANLCQRTYETVVVAK